MFIVEHLMELKTNPHTAEFDAKHVEIMADILGSMPQCSLEVPGWFGAKPTARINPPLPSFAYPSHSSYPLGRSMKKHDWA